MRLIARTLIILFAALLVVGGALALANTGVLASSGGFGEHGRPPATENLNAATGQSSFEGRRPGGDREGGAGIFGALEVLKDLGIIGLIVLLVAPIQRLVQRRRQPRAPARAVVQAGRTPPA